MPLIETKGAASAQGFGEFAQSGPGAYIEDVFQTWLYTGNSSTQTITNGIDLSTKGGLVWMKDRDSSTLTNILFDTARGATNYLVSSISNAQSSSGSSLTAFNSDGFTLGSLSTVNYTGDRFVSWTFRKQPKFFDVVTWTGTGANPQVISHNLGSVPGCIIVKAVNAIDGWGVYHRSLGADYLMVMNTTAAASGPTSGPWASTTPTSTQFTVGSYYNGVGTTFVAYLFAHDAGGFGLTGSDNAISCGSFSGNTTVTLGYEPQFIMVKKSDGASNWFMQDNMRGIPTGSNDATLFANLNNTESTSSNYLDLTATGFTTNYGAGTYIYIAIRRGPMKTPTSGTSVYTAYLPPGSESSIPTGFPADSSIQVNRSGADWSPEWTSRLTGQQYLTTSSNAAEGSTTISWASNTSIIRNVINGRVYYAFRRAPSFFDVVCYTGDGGSNRALSHNLTVVPELAIFKRRSGVGDWLVWTTSQSGNGALLNTTDVFFANANVAGSSAWTASTIYIKNPGFDGTATNGTGSTYVAYLFATCAGVSKVGSYTGTGALQTINCGFTGGARFVLIKRTDSTGGWYVYDSARGISSGNDPYLLLNSIAAEVTGTNYVDTTSVGFQVTAAAPAGLNANGGTYIFLAIA